MLSVVRFEHPASRSAAIRWAEISGKNYINIPHDSETGSVTAESYGRFVNSETRVATILHTSPVTGINNDIAKIAKMIRSVSSDCFIIVDGIQHAAHGLMDVASYRIDGYAISPYKLFSRHGYGVAWISDRLASLPHNSLINGPEDQWEMGTRDTGAYATFSDVVGYFEWLGGKVSQHTKRRDKIVAAGKAILAQEKLLTDSLLFGTGNHKGLTEIPGIRIIAGADNPHRKGMVCFHHESHAAADIVTVLADHGIRTHIRKADHYSGGILEPLGLDSCVRVFLLPL